MNETMVTLQGYVGGQVTVRRAGDSNVASFRVGCTPRRYVRRTDEWVSGQTQWFTVNAWRGWGEHCEASPKGGHAVVVHGRLRISTWVNASQVEVTTYEVEADVVGHDLNRGTSSFTRTGGQSRQQTEDAASPDVAQAGAATPAAPADTTAA